MDHVLGREVPALDTLEDILELDAAVRRFATAWCRAHT